jgi:hypothetical protein
MSLDSAPIKDPVVDREGFSNLSWVLFFNSLYEGDTGTVWSPTFQSLTEVGTPTITGRYYRISRRLVYFNTLIIPGTNTSSTAGTTYIDNFPLTFAGDGICFAVTGGLGDGPGHVISSSNRIYVPSWTTVTVPLTIIGLCEVAS